MGLTFNETFFCTTGSQAVAALAEEDERLVVVCRICKDAAGHGGRRSQGGGLKIPTCAERPLATTTGS